MVEMEDPSGHGAGPASLGKGERNGKEKREGEKEGEEEGREGEGKRLGKRKGWPPLGLLPRGLRQSEGGREGLERWQALSLGGCEAQGWVSRCQGSRLCWGRALGAERWERGCAEGPGLWAVPKGSSAWLCWGWQSGLARLAGAACRARIACSPGWPGKEKAEREALDAGLFYCSAGKTHKAGAGRVSPPAGFPRGVPSGFCPALVIAQRSQCPAGRWWSCACGQGAGGGEERARREEKEGGKEA